MPHYDYSCPDCERTDVDVFQKGTDAKLKTCPHCGSSNYYRHIGTGRVGIVKGGEVDNKKLTRQAHKANTGENLREDDQVFTSPASQETIHLTGSKADRKDQIFKLLKRDGYPVNSPKDVETPNL